MKRIEPEMGFHYIGMTDRICPRCRGYIVWEPRTHIIDYGYRYYCLMCNREFGEISDFGPPPALHRSRKR